MKRYYLTDILGTGAADVDDFRPVPAEYGVDYGWSMPSDQNGMPLNDWGLVEVSLASDDALIAMAADPRLDPLPYVALSTLVGDINPVALQLLRTAIVRRGIDVAAVDGAATFRAILDNITWHSNHP